LRQLELNDRQVDALLFYKDKKEITGLEYAERYKIAERTARADLAELVEKKILGQRDTMMKIIDKISHRYNYDTNEK